MYNIEQATTKIHDFLDSDMKGLLLTGTHQYQKHKLVMRILNESYKNAKILFRVNGMENLIDREFINLSKKPKAGETIKIGKNFYQFDSFNSGTWYRTDYQFDFVIVYPIDSFCREY